jgi:peptidoglycan hydrolase-like protein with peptidoglycan-binding domain
MSKLQKFLVGASIAVFAVILTASTASAAYVHTGTIRLGSRGASVMALQQVLNANGYTVAVSGAGSAGMETTYFGPATTRAVKAFQASRGLGADGVVGPRTGAALAALGGGVVVTPPSTNGCQPGWVVNPLTGQSCTGGTTNPNPGTTPPSSNGLKGTVGSLDYDLVSSLSGEEVGEDESDVKVAGLELDAEDSDSDVQITSVKLEFAQGTATNDDFDEFADEVSVWLDGTKVATVDASEFDDDNDYTKTIALSNAVVRMDDSADLVVAISGASSIESGDEGDTWTVNFDQIRFVDAQGATTTEDPGTGTRTFSFESFASANDVELEVALNSDADDINESHTITVDEDDETDNVSILAFTLESTGDSDITVSEIPVKVITSHSNISQVVTGVELYHGTTKVGSEDVSGTATSSTVTFDDLDITVDAGDEEEFTVKLSLANTDDYTTGTTVRAELAQTQVLAIDAEDESGEELSGSSELNGTAIGEASPLYVDGISVTAGAHAASAVSVDGSQNDYGSFRIRFSVTAIGDDIYLAKDGVTNTTTPSGAANVVRVEDSAGSAVTASGFTLSSNDADEGTYTFLIEEGDTADFELTVNAVDPGASVRAVLYGLAWGTSDAATPNNTYSSDFGVNGSYKTGYIYVND